MSIKNPKIKRCMSIIIAVILGNIAGRIAVHFGLTQYCLDTFIATVTAGITTGVMYKFWAKK